MNFITFRYVLVDVGFNCREFPRIDVKFVKGDILIFTQTSLGR